MAEHPQQCDEAILIGLRETFLPVDRTRYQSHHIFPGSSQGDRGEFLAVPVLGILEAMTTERSKRGNSEATHDLWCRLEYEEQRGPFADRLHYEDVDKANRDEPRRRMEHGHKKRATEQDRHPSSVASASARQEDQEGKDEPSNKTLLPDEEDQDSEPSSDEEDD